MTTRIIILAAGKGTRMQSEKPKALLPFNGRPMIMSLLDAVRASGVDPHPVVVIGHGAEQIRSVVGDGYEYVVQTEQRGTGHAVAVTRSLLEGKADAVLVLYVDHPLISAETIRRLVEVHDAKKPAITLLTLLFPHSDPSYEMFSHFGRIVRNDRGDIEKIVEITEATEDELPIREVNVALYCFDTTWIWKHLPLLKSQNKKNELFLTDLIEIAVKENATIASIPLDDPHEFIGVNTMEQLHEAERWI